MLPGGRRSIGDGHPQDELLAGAVLADPLAVAVDVHTTSAVDGPARAVADERGLLVDADETAVGRRGRGDERAGPRDPRVDDVPMRTEQDRWEVPEPRRPHALGVVAVGVVGRVTQACHAGAAARVGEGTVCDALLQS